MRIIITSCCVAFDMMRIKLDPPREQDWINEKDGEEEVLWRQLSLERHQIKLAF